MKHLRASLIAAIMTFTTTALASPLQIRIHGLRKNTGSIFVSLFARPESWDREIPDQIIQVAPLQGTDATTSVDLPPGEYAFFLYHDEDGNGELKRGAFGLPGEPYAFSNNVHIGFSKPSFAKMSFVVGTGGTVQDIQLVRP
jgi:uncharacterized protein (DUF2141 family)